MAGTIGIKIANGDFYPILTEENSTVKKRLILTTVHDRQESVQIDLHRSISKSMLDAQYIGSLVIESIRPRPRGEPSIEMIISCDENGNIAADARDLDAGADGEHHTLNVSLQTLETTLEANSSPDFDFGVQEPQPPIGLYDRTEAKKEKTRKFPWLIMGFAALFIIIVIILLWLFVLRGKDTPPANQTTSEQVTPSAPGSAPPPRAETPPPEPVVIRAPDTPPPERPQAVQRTRPPAPVASYNVPSVIPRNGAPYRIRWGDTLWDISEAFYRDPWLYPRIARFNNIRNPDLIIAGRTIMIPPKN
ncbi:MAG: LysM peptidoglycan-binding domain-containing protein [Treponema sp.]|nr:LysM peptidoglycan-binding domain-containing protein [Treponema sp.]